MTTTNRKHTKDPHAIYLTPINVKQLPDQIVFLPPPVMGPPPTDGEYVYETLLRFGLSTDIDITPPMIKGDSVNFSMSYNSQVALALTHIIDDVDLNNEKVHFTLHGQDFTGTKGHRVHFGFAVTRGPNYEIVAISDPLDVNVR